MLFALPFIAVALAFLSNVWQYIPDLSIEKRGIINLPVLLGLEGRSIIIVNFIVILALAYLLFYINERYKVLAQTTALPSLIYVLLTSILIVHLNFSNLLLSIVCVAFAIYRLQAAINNTKSNSPIYDFGFWISFTVLLSPKLVLLVVWAFCVLLFSGRSTVKDIMALFFGLLTPALFVTFYYFWVGKLELLPSMFVDNVFAGDFLRAIPPIETIRLGILAVLLLMSLYNIMNYYPVSVVNQRRGILSVVSLLLFLGITMFVIPGNYYDFIYVLALPLSFIYAQYFITHRIKIMGNLLFLLLLASCFL